MSLRSLPRPTVRRLAPWLASTSFLMAFAASAAEPAKSAAIAAPAASTMSRAQAAPPPALGLIVRMKPGTASRSLAYGAAAGTEQAQSQDAAATARLASAVASTSLKPQHIKDRGDRRQLLDFGRMLSGEEAQRMAEELRARPDVEWVVPNEREQLLQAVTPDDSNFGNQWWLFPASGSSANVVSDRRRGVPGIQTAWARDRGLSSGIVAVLDTGITSHPDLDPSRVLPGYDFVSNTTAAGDGGGRDNDPSDPGDAVSSAELQTAAFQNNAFAGCVASSSSWHGTSVAGIVAQSTNNGVDGASVSWNGRVLPVRVAGKCGAFVADIVDGMRWAGGLPVSGVPNNPNPARIINISFGGARACNAEYQAAIDALSAVGVVVVAAAGNDSGAVSRPANCRGVVAVGALNRDGFKASYANFGRQVTVSTVGGDPLSGSGWDSLSDPGIYTISNRGSVGPSTPTSLYRAGTSFSTPIVSGVLGLMLSVNPNLTRDELVTGVTATVRPHVNSNLAAQCSGDNPGRCICTTGTCGAGILDADEALRYAANPSGYVAPNRTGALIDSTQLQAAVASGPDRPANPSQAPTEGGGNGSTNNPDNGGGALGGGWLLALAAAVVAAGRRRSAASDRARCLGRVDA